MLKLTTSFGNEFHVFDSVAEVDGFTPKDKVESFLENSDFLGRHFDSYKEYEAAVQNVWDEGIITMESFIEKLEKADLPKIKDLKTRKVFNAAEGEIDFDRLMAGNPNHYVKTVTEKGEGTPEVTIVIDTCGNSGVSAQDLLWRGAAAIALVKLLEAQGYRTEIWTLCGATLYENHPSRGVTTCVLMKKPGDPLDISTLINTVSGWFFRAEIFALFLAIGEAENEPIKGSFGRHFIPTEKELDVLTSDQKRIFSSGTYSFNGALGLMMSEMRKIADREE